MQVIWKLGNEIAEVLKIRRRILVLESGEPILISQIPAAQGAQRILGKSEKGASSS